MSYKFSKLFLVLCLFLAQSCYAKLNCELGKSTDIDKLHYDAEILQDPRAQFELGLEFYNGSEELNKSIGRAVNLFRLSADSGYSNAQVALGYILINNPQYGTQQEAVKSFKLAAKQGNTVARNNLGFLYIFGLGVEEDYKKAKDLFTTDNTECEILNNFVLGRIIKDPNGNEEAVDFFSLPRK